MNDLIKNIEEFCLKYNILPESLPDILQDPKVLPMIRGKAFEFSAIAQFEKYLDKKSWKIVKPKINPQFGSSDQDVVINHLETHINIRVECKLAAKGRYRKVKANTENQTQYFEIDVKCMRSRTLGVERAKQLSTKVNIPVDVIMIHNDQYLPNSFDLVVTSIANAFYETDEATGNFEWHPKEKSKEFLEKISNKNIIDLQDESNLKDVIFDKVYIAKSNDVAALFKNNIKCTRRECKNPYSCGFIPNFPKIVFDLNTGKPLPPWLEIQDCLQVLQTFIEN
ncbi:MAG: hypothetical protein WAN66_16190 [Limnoraphis robusta]|uniref:Restriction endonuclease n=1 Tax=Limnoraphis robusta CS-951 TaxID=1637645 RepID=A0A0F5YF64_9CYAN|nr:hypothetical protein [Limnoraphis robusta]KKD37277.1 hypothetical protein WN50_15345 [Limnoraphis robusta CS-951]KMW70957.1 hypothetical protein WN50_31345 [Limnoraphis robusta CS-951]